MKRFCIILLFCLFVLCQPGLLGGEETVSSLLMNGCYNEITTGKTPGEKAQWAFARYYLSPGKEVFNAANEAHEAGNLLGTYVLMLCYEDGCAVRHSEEKVHQLNYQLRTRLEKLKNPNAVELYLLSETELGDEKGLITSEVDKTLEVINDYNRKRIEWLKSSAKKGFAHAVNEIGELKQEMEEIEEAYRYFEKAAKQGFCAALKNQGFLLNMGRGVEKDLEKGALLTRKAAEAGDIYAIINIAYYHAQGQGVEKDVKMAHQWLDRGVASGHWLGAMEKGLALLMGNYEIEVNKEEGKKLLQQAIARGQGEAIFRVATFYEGGRGLEKNRKKAIQFAEAAFVQGNYDTAAFLSYVYSERGGKDTADKKMEEFWNLMSRPNLAYTFKARDILPEVIQHLEKLDPFKLVVE